MERLNIPRRTVLKALALLPFAPSLGDMILTGCEIRDESRIPKLTEKLDKVNPRILWSGEFLYREELDDDTLIFGQDTLILEALDSRLVAIDLSSGRELWYKNFKTRRGYSDLESRLVYLINTQDKLLIAVEERTGREKWAIPWRIFHSFDEFERTEKLLHIKFQYDEGMWFIKTLSKETGEEVWSKSVSGGTHLLPPLRPSRGRPPRLRLMELESNKEIVSLVLVDPVNGKELGRRKLEGGWKKHTWWDIPYGATLFRLSPTESFIEAFIAVDLDTGRQWSREVNAALVLNFQKYLIGRTEDDYLVFVERETGNIYQKFKLPNQIKYIWHTFPFDFGEEMRNIYLIKEKGLIVVDLETGKQRWDTQDFVPVLSVASSIPEFENKTGVVIGRFEKKEDLFLIGFDLGNGRVRWSRPVKETEFNLRDWWGVVYFWQDGEKYLLNPHSGTILYHDFSPRKTGYPFRDNILVLEESINRFQGKREIVVFTRS